MEIIVSGRHYTVTPEFKDYSEKLISGTFDEVTLKITSVRLVLTSEKTRNKADIVVNVKSHNVEASAEEPEMGKAIAEAVEKAYKQVRKHLEKLHDHKHREPVKATSVEADKKAAEMEEEQ